MSKNKPFYYNYDDYEAKYIIKNLQKEVIFYVYEENEAKDITNFLNKQEDIITDLQKQKPISQEKKKIIDIINNKITKLGMDWYGAEDNSEEEKEVNFQLNVLEELRDELKEILDFN